MGRKKSCATCLWCWPEIHGEEGYRCYKPNAPSYHKVPTYVCDAYEGKATPTDVKMFWGEPQLKKQTKGWY